MTHASTNPDRFLTARAKAFSGEGVREHKIMISAEQVHPSAPHKRRRVVRVFDPVAGHYTCCHSLSAAAVRRILQLGVGEVK